MRKLSVLVASLFAVLFAYATPSQGATPKGIFAVRCFYSHSVVEDPIVNSTTTPFGHRHDFFGNRSTRYNSTYQSMTTSSTKCRTLEDTAGYWNPAASLSSARVPGSSLNVYYVGTPDIQVASFPEGLQMIAGNKQAANPGENPHVTWFCGVNTSPLVDHPYDCTPYSGAQSVTAFVEFPKCYDGSGLATWDQGVHMAYPDGNGVCSDPSFPVTLPRITYRVHFGIMDPCDTRTPCTADNAGDATDPYSSIRLSLSSGAFWTMHADFWNTWNQTRLDDLVANCLDVHIDCGTVTSSPTIADSPTLSATGTAVAIDLSWTVPLSTGGSEITGYAIYRSTDNAAETDTAPTSPLATVGNSSSYSDTSVTPGSTYYYRVAAINALGEGMLSNQASGTPTSATSPGAPTLTAKAIKGRNKGIVLSWTVPSNGGSPIDHYNLYKRLCSGGTYAAGQNVGNVTSYKDTAVTAGVSYCYQVTASNSVGEGPASSEASATAK